MACFETCDMTLLELGLDEANQNSVSQHRLVGQNIRRDKPVTAAELSQLLPATPR
jgi:hypothetical protein